jgi:hypothetical protein
MVFAMASVLIQNATVLPLGQRSDGSQDLTPQVMDVWVEGDRIRQVATKIDTSADEVIDAREHS